MVWTSAWLSANFRSVKSHLLFEILRLPLTVPFFSSLLVSLLDISIFQCIDLSSNQLNYIVQTSAIEGKEGERKEKCLVLF